MRLVVPLGPNVSFVTKDLVKVKNVVEELEVRLLGAVTGGSP
jgi:hypothetical protein